MLQILLTNLNTEFFESILKSVTDERCCLYIIVVKISFLIVKNNKVVNLFFKIINYKT